MNTDKTLYSLISVHLCLSVAMIFWQRLRERGALIKESRRDCAYNVPCMGLPGSLRACHEITGSIAGDRSVENHAHAVGRKAEMTLGSAGLTARAMKYQLLQDWTA